MKSLSVNIQMKPLQQFFPVVFFIMLCKVIPTFESVDEILKCSNSNECHCGPIALQLVVFLLKVEPTLSLGMKS